LRISFVGGFDSRYVLESEIVERYLFSLYAFVISATETPSEDGAVGDVAGVSFVEGVGGGDVGVTVVGGVRFPV
jgi:hypothetical protein